MISDFLRAKEINHKEKQERDRRFKSARAIEIKVLAVISLRRGRREKYKKVNISLSGQCKKKVYGIAIMNERIKKISIS